MAYMHWHSCLISAHDVIGIYYILRGIYIFNTYLAVMCEVTVAVCCVLVDMVKYAGSLSSFSIMAL